MIWGGKCFDIEQKTIVESKNGFCKEYHQDMNFDILWGNDIVSSQEKNPEKFVDDNQHFQTTIVKIQRLKTFHPKNL